MAVRSSIWDIAPPFGLYCRLGYWYIRGKVFIRASSPDSSIIFGSGLKTSKFLRSTDLGDITPLLLRRMTCAEFKPYIYAPTECL